jgi:tetratricopeptide (TPR) repeat protein
MTSSSAQEGDRPPGSFVGRERELAELHTGLGDVTAGHSHLFLLSGEPGIGKTRLADEFGRQAVAQGVRVAWGRCWEGSGAPAYWPWIQAVRACLGDTDAEQRAAILSSEATPQVAQDIAQLLPELRAAHAPNPRYAGAQPADPEQARFQLFESVVTLLKNVARIGSLMVVIDDLHDADHPSLLLLKFVAGHSKDARILLVGTYRDTEVRQSQELTRMIGDLSREGHSLPIVGLSEAEVGEFVASSAGKKADDKLVADLYQATDGNPLFVDGVVRLLVAEGKLDRARLDSSAFNIPDGVRESIRRQLVKLSEETNLMLSIASVIGNDFEMGLLGQVSRSAAEEVIERMEEAGRAGIVIDCATGASRFRFSHALVREALYKDLSAKSRIELHGEIGAAIEEVYKDNLKQHLAALAHHFRAAGNARKAIDYSIAAADEAEAVFAYENALAHLRPVLAMAESREHDDSQRAAVLLRLGRISCFFENREQGVTTLETALKIYEQIGDDQHTGEIHSHLGRVFAPFGPQMHVGRALFHFQRAEVLLKATSDEHSLGWLYWGLSHTNFDAMRLDDAIVASQKAMDIYARLGERESWAGAAGNHAQYLTGKGKLARAEALLDEIARAAASFANPDAFRHMSFVCGWFRLLTRDPKEAIRFFRLGLTRPGFNTITRALLVDFLVLSELLTGNLGEAKRLAAEYFVNQVFRSQIAFYEGDRKAAGEMLAHALDWSQNVDSKWNQVNTLTFIVELLRVSGDYDGAAAAFERALSLYAPDDLFWEMRVRPQAAMLCIDAGRPEEAEHHLEYCRKILAQQEDWLGVAGPFWRAEAIVAAVQDRFQESESHFEKSIKIFKRYSLPWYEAETLHYWGRALLHAGQLQRAREKLDGAIKIYHRHGAGHCWIDRVEADKRRARPSPRMQTGLAGAEMAGAEAVFRNEGDFWTIAYLDRSFRLKDMRGLHYIAYLLAHPNERFHVRELAASLGGDALPAVTTEPGIRAEREDAPPILDSKAKADYRARLSELRADLDEAEQMNDSGRAERIRQELEFVNDELSAAVGLSGRDRKMSDQSERTRLRIGRVIRWALSEIREHDPSLGHHFSTCIHTGYYCAYTPDPRQRPSWNL